MTVKGERCLLVLDLTLSYLKLPHSVSKAGVRQTIIIMIIVIIIKGVPNLGRWRDVLAAGGGGLGGPGGPRMVSCSLIQSAGSYLFQA